MPLQYNLYKGITSKFGACQFSVKEPDWNNDSPGVVFVNACSSTGPNVYDWDNKFVFALSIGDLGKILHYFVSAGEKESLNLVHDPNKGKEGEGSTIKSMSFYTQNGCLQGAMITCTTKTGDNVATHKIPLSGDEVIVLKSLFDAAIPRLLGWT
jgi:hypothetical protein